MDTITKNGELITYNLTLYGGLGEFFYNLTYDNEGNKKTLASLDYLNSGDTEFDLTINKDVIEDAWDNIEREDKKWSCLNFAPCYNGLPDNFDSDKAILNWKDSVPPFTSSVTEDNITYTPSNGYSLMNLGVKRTEWEVRDLRSYLQRPILRIKRFIQAISKPQNNGGYTVNLDTDFFNSTNPYYNDTWLTLPLVSELEYENKTESTSVTVTLGSQIGEYFPINVTTTEPLYTANSLILQLGLAASPTTTATTLYTNNKWENYWGMFYWNCERYYNCGGVFFQLVGYDALGNTVAGSDIYLCTSEAAQEVTYQSFKYTPAYGSSYRMNIGKFLKSGSTFTWCNLDGSEANITLNLSPSSVPIATMKLRVTNYGNFYTEIDTTTWRKYTTGTNPALVSAISTTTSLKGSKLEITNGGTYTNAKVTKKLLLNTDGSPCDYLLSYAKHFGLHFEKDIHTKTINIYTRDNYYKVDEDAVDISDYIDYSREMKITPIAFDTKWYDFKLDQVEGVYQKDYKSTTSVEYGLARVNTGYDFDAENNDLLKGNVFKCAVEGLEKSEAFVKSNNGFEVGLLSQPCEYNLYNASTSITRSISWYDTTNASGINVTDKYYDLYPKVQFHSADNKGEDGRDVLLMYVGDKTNLNNTKYFVTDDNAIMFALNNGKPCW